MSIDLSSLSAKELESLISLAKKRKTTLNKRKPIAAVRKRISQVLKTEGYTLEELFGGAAPAAARSAGKASKAAKPATAAATRKARKPLGKVAPKYRNPANTGETWTGRGKQPRWLAAYTAQGKKLEDFLIK
ncbi:MULTISPECIES: H-NS histone family protein [unclassified Lysobacter]|uniref:H-NS histone family protein n=1 Tax=unclassified Lysobacter TaxID=2635362 RepID=UPI001BE9E619|nr:MULTISPECIES: H-NS histone family protein [unclassified Lysobacter]MBT2745030.1 H-NS histone family protein [Lysobacter sp. ISL-42]MBT2750966.1 H-NS histone family protein [Lysobacter sp. ISL-50]MBT2779780.1 H-NS histone family protein [Lysobacter sp. ISL-54]MBT2782843.1 H-NS histone family protein [Lysobacter sp. ISL-52]